jgi:hypothetical protein
MRMKALTTLLSLLLLPALVVANGKLRGTVLDKETKEALVGANVSLEGTTLGGATDINGEFTVLNIPAGLYTVRATFVGYATVSISNVRINNGLTTELEFSLSSESVQLQAVEIVAERPLVNKNATNAVRITTGEDIEALPVRGINNVLALQAGVVLQDNTVFIRGGRQDEVGFYLEGASITNPMVGGRAVTIVQDAVEEIQVQAGGYSAEFGGANAGIIQQQLKSGTPDWRGSAEYITDNIALKGKDNRFEGKKRLGAYWFGYNEFTGSMSGPLFDERFKFFGLFNYNYQRDQNPQPYPGINIGLVTDPSSGDSVNLVYPAGPVLKNSLEQYTYTATLTLDFKPVTIRFAGTFTDGTTYSPFNTNRNAGNIANILNLDRIEQWDQTDGTGSLKITHLLNPTTFYEISAGYFRQTRKTFDPYLGDNFLSYGDSIANAEVGWVWERGPGDPTGRYIRPTSESIFTFRFNAPGDVTAAYAKWKRENISLNGSFFTQIGGEHSIKVGGEYQRYTIRNYSWNNESVFAIAGLLDANSQLAADQRKTAEQVLINRGVNNFGYDVFGNEISSGGITGAKHPVFAAAYVQDKIEYKDLVMNLGVRFDYIDVDNKAFIDPTRPELAIDNSTGEIFESGLRDVAPFSGVSPRIGLSFPVTDQTVFHAQYGKFVQQSRLRDAYQGLFATSFNLKGGFFVGAPVGFDVRPTRTTQYEIGFTQQIGDFASFDITGYYKDIKDQIVYDQINTANGSPFGGYAVLRNGDFATTKGVELTFNMRRLQRLQVNASLAFQDAQGTGSYPNSNRGIVGAPLDGVTRFAPQYIAPLEFNNAFRGNLNLDYRFGKSDGGPILEQLGASALVTFNSGHPFTRGIGGADLEGNARDRSPIETLNASTTPSVFQVDLRIDKTFQLFESLSANVYVFVINLFDARNIQNVFLRTGSVDDDGYLSDPALGGTLISTFGQKYAQMYRAINIDYYETYQNAVFLNTVPFFYGPPRQVRFGIRLDY